MMYSMPIVEYLCPACGNPYFGSGRVSYSCFRFIKFSDGMVRTEVPLGLWLTRCPRCGQFFAKEYLFEIPMDREMVRFIRRRTFGLLPRRTMSDEECLKWEKEKREKERNYGHCDHTLKENESVVAFLEQAIEKGLYFPVRVLEWKKKTKNIELYKRLWWEYNRRRDRIPDEKYMGHCKKLIEMILEARFFVEEKDLMLAELYRNVGDFEKSRRHLEQVRANENTQPYIDCINAQLEQENTQPAVVAKSDNWGGW